jgi:hypothetical protein
VQPTRHMRPTRNELYVVLAKLLGRVSETTIR